MAWPSPPPPSGNMLGSCPGIDYRRLLGLKRHQNVEGSCRGVVRADTLALYAKRPKGIMLKGVTRDKGGGNEGTMDMGQRRVE